MGVKAIKEKYKIEHIVQRKGDTIWIGSALNSEIIGINMDGQIIKYYKNLKYNDGWSTNEDLKRYQEEMLYDGGNGILKQLVQKQDKFGEVKPIFKIEDGKVIELFCEEFGWPNVCTNGEIQYENTFFDNYKEAYNQLLSCTKLDIKYSWKSAKRNISEYLNKFFKTLRYFLIDIQSYIHCRTIQRIKGLKYRK